MSSATAIFALDLWNGDVESVASPILLDDPNHGFIADCGGCIKVPIAVRGVLQFAPMLLIFLGLAQTIPIPSFLASTIGPSEALHEKIVSEASKQSGIERESIDVASRDYQKVASSLSIYPAITSASLVGLACGVGMLFAGSIFFSDRMGGIILLVTLIVSTSAVAVLGIFQSVSWKSWTLLEMPIGSFFSTFVNRNSAPQFLAVGIGSIIALLADRKRSKDRLRRKSYQRRYPATTLLGRVRHVFEDLVLELDTAMVLLLSALALLVIAVVAAGSRGGVVSLAFGTSVTFVFFVLADRRAILATFFGILLVAFMAGSMLNLFELNDTISERIQDLSSWDRIDLWRSALSQTEFWLSGSGMGTFQFAIMPVNPMQTAWPRHAESIYVEVASDFGILGVGLLLGWMASFFARILPSDSTRSKLLWPAATYAILTIGMHSTVDFGLILPAIFLPLAALAGAFIGETKSHTTQHSTRRPNQRSVQIASLSLAMLAIFIGMNSLSGFCQSEDIARELAKAKKSVAQTPQPASQETQFSSITKTLDLKHPEVVFQLARVRLFELEQHIQQFDRWPSNLTAQQRKQLSSPEFVASVLRSKRTDEPWNSLRRLFESDPEIRRRLQTLHEAFRYQSRFHSLDWRSSWGLFQTNVQQDPAQSSFVWAKADFLGGSVFNVRQTAATCLLIAGDHQMGIHGWKNAISDQPRAVSELGNLLGNLLTEEEISQIVPNHPIAIARMAKSIHATRQETSLALLDSISVVDLRNSCSSVEEWELAAWVAQQTNQDELLFDALSKIASVLPFDVSIRLRLARFHEEHENLEEAVRILEQAGRRTTLNSETQTYLESLKKRLLTTPTPQDNGTTLTIG